MATHTGSPLNPTTYTSWNDWVDAGTPLSIDETVTVSATERHHTVDTFSWTVNSPLDVVVSYYHQYSVEISTTGLDAAYSSTISVVQHGSVCNPATSATWSDWADASSALSISETISVSITERFHTIDSTTWVINSALTVNVSYYHQYKPTLISNGLNSGHPATMSYAQHGTEYSMTTSSTWMNWTDAGRDLNISDMINVSERERYRTLDNTSWTVDSAFTATVDYIHQFKPIISLVGTDGTHTVGVIHEKDTTYHNDTGVLSSWSDWVDENTTLTFDECTSGSPTRCTTDTRTWTVASAFDATVNYIEEDVDTVKEANHKPFVALVFAIILLLVGTYVTSKKPLNMKDDEKRNKMFNFLFVVMPFVIIEAITGIISLLTGLLSIPPLIGPGTIVDLLILISGLVAFVLVYKGKIKGKD
jgi:hypothetical protein